MLAASLRRVAAPSVCFAAARILLAAAPTAPPCFRHWRRSSLLHIFLCFSHLRLRRRFYLCAELHALRRRNTCCEAANRRNEKKALSAATSFFPFRQLLRDYQGRAALDSCLPRLESSGCFSGSLLARKRELSPAKKRSAPRTGARTISGSLLARKREPYSAFFKNSGSSFSISASAFPRWLMASFSSGVSWA